MSGTRKSVLQRLLDRPKAWVLVRAVVSNYLIFVFLSLCTMQCISFPFFRAEYDTFMISEARCQGPQSWAERRRYLTCCLV